MKDFYFRVSKKERPHILGLTASPLQNNIQPTDLSIKIAMDDLENGLDSKIYRPR